MKKNDEERKKDRTVTLLQKGNEELVGIIRFEPFAGVVKEVEIVRKTGHRLRITASKNAVFSASSIKMAEDVGCIQRLRNYALDMTEDDMQTVLNVLQKELAKGADAAMIRDEEPDVMEVFGKVCQKTEKRFAENLSIKQQHPEKNGMLYYAGVDISGRVIRVKKEILDGFLQGTGFTSCTFVKRLKIADVSTGKNHLVQAGGDVAHYGKNYTHANGHVRAYTFIK